MIERAKECLNLGRVDTGEIKGEFKVTHRGSLSEDRSIPVGWVAVSSHWMKSFLGEDKYEEIRRKMYGTWWRIEGPKGSTYRVFRMSPQLKGADCDQNARIALDWGGRIDLLGEPNKNDVAELTLRPINRKEYLCCILNNPDPAYLAARLPAFASIGLGILSIGLGILSIILAVC